MEEGRHFSIPSTNPSSINIRHTTMSSDETTQNPKSEPNQSEKQAEIPHTQIPDPPINDHYQPKEHHEEGFYEDELNQEEEEEGECGFCLFMKGGGCRDTFISWEECVEEAEKKDEDVVEKCFEVTAALKKCMLAHPDYYSPILQAEKAAEEEAVQELEKEKAKDSGSGDKSSSEEPKEAS